MQLKERKVWIDYAKFISIFLVVLFHTNPNLDGYIFDFLKLLRMPAFFLIAGLLFDINKWNDFTNFFKHRFKRLIVPYFWFSLIFYVLWLAIGRDMVGESELMISRITPIKEFLMGTPNVVLAPYWFITCLFCMQILFYLLKKTIHSNIIIICIAISLYFIIIYLGFNDLPWCLDKAIRYLPFYTLANILREKIDSQFLQNKYILFLSTISAICLLTVDYKYDVSPYTAHLIYITSGFCIMPIYIAFCKFLALKSKNSQVIKYVGDNNIVTLALQNYIIGFIKILGMAVFSINLLSTDYYAINVLIALLTIAISIVCALCINKYVPFIVGKTYK